MSDLIESREEILKRQNVTELHFCALRRDLAGIKMLLEDRKYDVDELTSKGWTPLMIAASKNFIEIVELLLQYGADVKRQIAGWTALEFAKFYDYKDIVSLIEKYTTSAQSGVLGGNIRSTRSSTRFLRARQSPSKLQEERPSSQLGRRTLTRDLSSDPKLKKIKNKSHPLGRWASEWRVL